jgi:hypothetical protein
LGHDIAPIVYGDVDVLVDLIQGAIRAANSCAGIPTFPWDHGFTTASGILKEKVLAEGETSTVGVGGGSWIAGLDTLSVDPVHIWREKKRTNEKKMRSLD